MIRSFADRATRQLWETEKSKVYGQFARVALRKLMQLNAADQLDDLKMPPGNRLEGLKGGSTRAAFDSDQSAMAYLFRLERGRRMRRRDR
jgi:plasmid maintenance system killer protein